MKAENGSYALQRADGAKAGCELEDRYEDISCHLHNPGVQFLALRQSTNWEQPRALEEKALSESSEEVA